VVVRRRQAPDGGDHLLCGRPGEPREARDERDPNREGGVDVSAAERDQDQDADDVWREGEEHVDELADALVEDAADVSGEHADDGPAHDPDAQEGDREGVPVAL